LIFSIKTSYEIVDGPMSKSNESEYNVSCYCCSHKYD